MLDVFKQTKPLNIIFAFRVYVAVVVATYISFRYSTSINPTWSIVTIYVISQPYAGQVLSKSKMRIIGTIIGAFFAVLFGDLFNNNSTFYLLVLVPYIGLTAFTSAFLGDSPKAYAAALSGYTVAIIGLVIAMNPTSSFNEANGRLIQIFLGIICGTIAHTVIFPNRAGPVLKKSIDSILPEISTLIIESLRPETALEHEEIEDKAKGKLGDEYSEIIEKEKETVEKKILANQKHLLSNINNIESMRTPAMYDTPVIRPLDPTIKRFEQKLVSLVSLISAAKGQIKDMDLADHKLTPEQNAAVQEIIDDIIPLIEHSKDLKSTQDAKQLKDKIDVVLKKIADKIPQEEQKPTNTEYLQYYILLDRFEEMIRLWSEAVTLHADIVSGVLPPKGDKGPDFITYHDWPRAISSGVLMVTTLTILSVFWIQSAWTSGQGAFIVAAVMGSLMGSKDNTQKILYASLIFIIVTAFAPFVGNFMILPKISSYTELMIALAPYYFAIAFLMSFPKTAALGMGCINSGVNVMGLQNHMKYDIASMCNSMAATILGMAVLTAVSMIVVPIGTGWAISRVRRLMMLDLAKLAREGKISDRSRFEGRMFGMTNELYGQLDVDKESDQRTMWGALAALRVGMNILSMHKHTHLSPGFYRELTKAKAYFGRIFERSAYTFGANNQGVFADLNKIKSQLEQEVQSGEDMQVLALITRTIGVLHAHPEFFRLEK